MIRANQVVVLRYTGTNAKTGRLTVPAELMAHMAEGTNFLVEVNDDGILYRPVGQEVVQEAELPEWMRPKPAPRKRNNG